jgi:integrase/recombinase XerD
VGDLRGRPRPQTRQSTPALTPPTGLSNATLQQRLTAVRLFFDFLIEEGQRTDHPVGRGRYTPGKAFGIDRERALVPRFQTLPWIPSDEQWRAFLAVVKEAPLRTRCMAAFAYDAGLRREELCSLHSSDLDPAQRMVRVRAEVAKGSRERVVPYSATTGELLRAYLAHRRTIATSRGPLFLSESPRNFAQPITLWTWSKVVRQLALQADLPHFSTHTFRHLCLTDLARSGWELHQIAQFAGHRNPQTTLLYIHLSGHDLAEQLTRGMSHIHAWRVQTLAHAFADDRTSTQETPQES